MNGLGYKKNILMRQRYSLFVQRHEIMQNEELNTYRQFSIYIYTLAIPSIF